MSPVTLSKPNFLQHLSTLPKASCSPTLTNSAVPEQRPASIFLGGTRGLGKARVERARARQRPGSGRARVQLVRQSLPTNAALQRLRVAFSRAQRQSANNDSGG